MTQNEIKDLKAFIRERCMVPDNQTLNEMIQLRLDGMSIYVCIQCDAHTRLVWMSDYRVFYSSEFRAVIFGFEEDFQERIKSLNNI